MAIAHFLSLSAASPGERRAFAWFAAASALLAGTWFLAISLRYAIWSVGIQSVRNPFLRLEAPDRGALWEFAFLFAVITAAYAVSLWAIRRGFPGAFRTAIIASAIAGVAVLPQVPFFSPDVTHFAADVRTLWVHGKYPARCAEFQRAPDGTAFCGPGSGVPGAQNDPIGDQVVAFKNLPSGYGPVTYVVGGITIPFTGTNLRAAVFGQKVLSGVLWVVVAGLTGLVAKRAGRDPAFVTAAVGLNPLFLLMFAGDGHNDTIMIALGMGALLLATGASLRSRAGAVGLGALAALAKVSLLVTVPVLAAHWFPRWRSALAALFFAAATSAIIWIRLAEAWGLGTGGPLIGTTENTPYRLFNDAFDLSRNGRATLVVIAYIAFFAVTALIMWRHRLTTPSDLVAALGLQMALFLFLFAPTLRFWYVAWGFPFILLAGHRWLTAGALTFTSAALVALLMRNFGDTFQTDLGIANPKELAVAFSWTATIVVAFVVWRLGTPGAAHAERRPDSRATRRRNQRAPARGKA